jgi:hypothetical protein
VAWFIIALTLAIIPNQVLAEEIPKLPGGLNLQNILILFSLIALMGTMGLPKDATPPQQAKLPRYLKWYLLLTFIAIFTAPFITEYASFPMGLDDDRVTQWRDEFTGILMFFVAARCIRTEDEVRKVLFVIVCASAYFVGYYLVRYYPEIDRIQALPQPSYFGDAEWIEEKKWMIKKVSGVFTQVGSNEMAAYYVYVALFCIGLGWEYRSGFWRVVVPIEIVVLLMGVVYSASRGAMLSTAGGIAYAFFRKRKWLIRVAIFCSAMIPAFSSDDSATKRFELWGHALEFGVKYPCGVGYHAFPEKHKEVYNEKLDTHNYFMRAFAEVGPIGFFLLVSCFAGGARLGWKLYDTGRTDFSKGVGRGVGMMWGAALICNMFGDRISYANLGVVIWAITGFAFALFMREERERAAEAFQVVGQEAELKVAPELGYPEPALR